ncbi:DUF6088 family protein [Acetobacterium sp.]|uniref:DUF6088 family protein n=1 Tax=Acetobacterium sp. TaxID=1872094 RepID=UPI0035941068
MERTQVKEIIENKIAGYSNGALFVSSDFLDYGNYEAVKRALARLADEKKIIRIMRGIYKKPNFSEFLQEEVEASPIDVAKIYATTYGWTIIPYSDTALNLLGLSTQVPSVYTFVSDGPYRKVMLDNGILLEFRHRANREISGLSYKSALIIEAFRAIGKEGVNEEIRHTIRSKCTVEELKKLKEESIYSRNWIIDEIKKL